MTEGTKGVRTRVKICGVTDPDDAAMACAAGADAIGLNFHPASPRGLDVGRAGAVAARIAPFVSVVAVLVDPAPELVRSVLQRVGVDCLQFAGDERADFCRGFGVPYLKSAGVGEDFDFAALEDAYPDAAGFLLDAADPILRGGTGQTFDWSRWPATERPLLLAGGLTPANVGAAIRRTRPFAVDVASGVEGGVKGRKDGARLRAFMAEVGAARAAPDGEADSGR